MAEADGPVADGRDALRDGEGADEVLAGKHIGSDGSDTQVVGDHHVLV